MARAIQVKVLCLVFVVAIAATCIFAAGSASAVALCKENKNPCPNGMTYPKDTEFAVKTPKGGSIAFSGPVLNITCNGSAITYKLGAESASPLPGSFTAFTLSPCEGCKTASVPFLPYSAEVKEVGGKWVLTYKTGGSGFSRIKFSECPLGVECTFSKAETDLEFSGGQPAKLTATSQTLVLVAGNTNFCGAKVDMGGTWEIAEATEPGQKGVANPPVWPQMKP